jgi:hypothetical protein
VKITPDFARQNLDASGELRLRNKHALDIPAPARRDGGFWFCPHMLKDV